MASKILKYILSFEMLLEGKCRLIKNYQFHTHYIVLTVQLQNNNL